MKAGINVIYKNFISISLYSDITNASNLIVSCFPEDYYISPINLIKNSDIDILLNPKGIFNQNTISNTYSSLEGTWAFTRCAYSYTNEEYYLDSLPIQPLVKQVLYNEINSEYQWRNVVNAQDENTLLLIQNASLNNESGITSIYIHTINIYNEYIEQSHNFKNSYLYNVILSASTLRELIFSVDFENINTTTLLITYSTQDYIKNSNLSLTSKVSIITNKNSNDFITNVSSNKVVLCDPMINKIYSSGTNTCINLTSCPALNYKKCYDNNKALSCKDTYYLISSSSTCSSTCPIGTIRSPNSYNKSSICNLYYNY